MRLKLYPVNPEHAAVEILGIESLTETPQKLSYRMKTYEGGALIELPTIPNDGCGEWEINGRRYNAWLFQAEHLPVVDF